MKVGDLIQTKRIGSEYVTYHIGIVINEWSLWTSSQGSDGSTFIKVAWDDGEISWTDKDRVEVISEGR